MKPLVSDTPCTECGNLSVVGDHCLVCDDTKYPYRVTERHPWEAWRGDIVYVVGDHVNGECRFEGPTLLPEWQWLVWLTDGALDLPCIWHDRHVRVRGPWSGVIPFVGLEPLR